MMDRCEELADELDAGRMGPMQLTREVARLRLAFDAHNRFEEQLLRPVLLATDSFGEVRVEHNGRRARRRAPRDARAARLGGDLGSARGDRAPARAPAGGERYFLTARVLRDDLVTVEGVG